MRISDCSSDVCSSDRGRTTGHRRVSDDVIANTVVALVALGMGLAFVSADRRSPTSRALAATYAYIGLSIYLNLVWTGKDLDLSWRSEERRVGQECVCTCRYRGSSYH